MRRGKTRGIDILVPLGRQGRTGIPVGRQGMTGIQYL